MTEQENREKAIEEIEKIMSGICKKVEVCPCSTCSECKAMSIYDAGYRKVDKDGVFHIDISDELREDFFRNEIKKAQKERAKEVIDKIVRIFKDFYREDSILTAYDVLNHIAYTAEEFGVEVEE